MESINITTWNDLLLPPFLFLLYFFSGCILLQTLKQSAKISLSGPETSKNQANSDKIVLSQDFQTNPEPEPPKIVPPQPEKSLKTKKAQLPSTKREFNAQIAAILEQLNKRQSRKICAPLNIRQKQKGVEKSLERMKAEILAIFQSQPEKVIEVMGARLPELMPKSAS